MSKIQVIRENLGMMFTPDGPWGMRYAIYLVEEKDRRIEWFDLVLIPATIILSAICVVGASHWWLRGLSAIALLWMLSIVPIMYRVHRVRRGRRRP